MSKSKLLLILVSLATTAASVWVYVSQQQNKKYDDSVNSQIRGKLIGYDLYRYHKDGLTARTSGKKAIYNAKGELICEERFKSVRLRGTNREEVESQTAIFKFPTEAGASKKIATVETIELIGGVEFIRGESRFQTEWLLYTEKTREAFTDKPIRIESDGQFVAAEGGMTYNLQSESLKMRGGIIGTAKAEAVQSGIGGLSK